MGVSTVYFSRGFRHFKVDSRARNTLRRDGQHRIHEGRMMMSETEEYGFRKK